MSVSIKVSVRCRPFTIDDKLGVFMKQHSEEDGEVSLVNSQYSTTRFGFSYSWWSAYGWERRAKSNEDMCADMELIHQGKAYDRIGNKIKKDLLDGNAVVLFAYGMDGAECRVAPAQ